MQRRQRYISSEAEFAVRQIHVESNCVSAQGQSKSLYGVVHKANLGYT